MSKPVPADIPKADAISDPAQDDVSTARGSVDIDREPTENDAAPSREPTLSPTAAVSTAAREAIRRDRIAADSVASPNEVSLPDPEAGRPIVDEQPTIEVQPDAAVSSAAHEPVSADSTQVIEPPSPEPPARSVLPALKDRARSLLARVRSSLTVPAPTEPEPDQVTAPLDDRAAEKTPAIDAAQAEPPVETERIVPEAVPAVGDTETAVDETKPIVEAAKPTVPAADQGVVELIGLTKHFGETIAAHEISLRIPSGSFYGIVGPNGAGKTTTLSMVTGLLRPDAGSVHVNGIDVWAKPAAAKRTMGVLPDRMRLFDRLTGAQLLYYSGALRGLDGVTVRSRVQSLTRAFGLEDAVGRLISDYSAGMSKKIALACALIHSPRVLVLDEPFESVDPVSAASITEILQKYVENGGTVVLSSHGMEFIERVCDNVAIIVGGEVLAEGTVDEVRAGRSLEERFIELVGGRKATEDLEWLHSFSD